MAVVPTAMQRLHTTGRSRISSIWREKYLENAGRNDTRQELAPGIRCPLGQLWQGNRPKQALFFTRPTQWGGIRAWLFAFLARVVAQA